MLKFVILITSLLAHAEGEPSRPLSPDAYPSLVNDLSPMTKAEELGRPAFLMRFQSEKYRNINATGRDRSSFYPSVSARMAVSQDWKIFSLTGEIEGFITATQTKNRFVNVPEFYIGSGDRFQSVKIAAGRKKVEWSKLDDSWRLGMWQPRFRWDYFDPEMVGLTGLFSTVDVGKWQFTAYASPLFVPEQGATFDEDNGTITSTHPFFSPPPKSLPVFEEETDLRYSIVIPSIGDVILNPGGSLQAKYENQGFTTKFGYGYLPINQILVGYEAYQYLPKNHVQVKIHPRVVYHHIASLDSAIKKGNWEFSLSSLLEVPNDINKPQNLTVQNAATGFLVSPTLQYKRGDGAIQRSAKLSFLQTVGGIKNDSGLLAQGQQQIMESRYPYRTAISLSSQHPLFTSGNQFLSLHGKVIYDFTVRGSIYSAELHYGFQKSWDVSFGFDLIGAGKMKAPQEGGGADFFGYYRANDRIRGGIAYVF